MPRLNRPGSIRSPTTSRIPPTKPRGMPSSSAVPTSTCPPARVTIFATRRTRAICPRDTATKALPVASYSQSMSCSAMKSSTVVRGVLRQPHHPGHLPAREEVQQLQVSAGRSGQLARVARAGAVSAELRLHEHDVLPALGEA